MIHTELENLKDSNHRKPTTQKAFGHNIHPECILKFNLDQNQLFQIHQGALSTIEL